MPLYERQGHEVPDGTLVSFTVLYATTPFWAGTVLEIGVAPWAGRIVHAQSVVQTVVTGTSDITIEIDGGSALDTLVSGTTKGTADVYTPGQGDDIAAGGAITATSDANASAGDVLITVIIQKGAAA